MGAEKMSLKFRFKSCKTLRFFLRDSGSEFQTVGPMITMMVEKMTKSKDKQKDDGVIHSPEHGLTGSRRGEGGNTLTTTTTTTTAT